MGDETRMRLFMQVYAEGMQSGAGKLMFAKSEEDILKAFETMCIGMIAANNCLEKHGRVLGLSRLVRWIKAVVARDTVVNSMPSTESLKKIPAYLAATWFEFKIPEAQQHEIGKKALQMDAAADEEARKKLLKEGAAMTASK